MQTTTNEQHSQLIQLDRTFSVPVEQLFNAFTNSESLKCWWWPEGMYTDRVDYNFEEGGKYFINMKSFEDNSSGMNGEFLEIVKNKRIVMTDHFADINGRTISAAEANMPGAWPEVIHITFEFESIDGSHSRCRLTQDGIPKEMLEDCTRGWSQSFDKLKTFLTKH